MFARIGKIRIQALLLGAVPLAFLLLLVIVAAVLVVQAQRISVASQEATRILGQSEALGQVIGMAGRGANDYAVGRKSLGLSEYRRAVAAFPAQAHALLAIVVTEPPQQRANAQRYVALSRTAMAVIKRYLAMIEAGHISQSRAFGSSTAVRTLSTSLTAVVTSFDQYERASTIARFDAFSRGLRLAAEIILLSGILGIALTMLATAAFGWRIVHRLEVLAGNARRLGAGQAVRPIDGVDEIAMLDRIYQEITERLREALRQKEELLDAYEREHHVASTLQQALLPHELPALPSVRIDAAYLPAAKSAEIGGDWYDVFMLSERVLAIGVGDVAGHDLRAATVMGAVRQAVRIAAREDADPAGVLRRVNIGLCDEHHLIVSAFFGTLDLNDGTLRYAMAGHPPPIVVRENRETEPLEGRGIVLGINRRAEFETNEVRLDVGCGLVLYTDGVVEAERDYAKGEQKLDEAIRSEAFSPHGNIAELIQRRVFAGVEPRDDSAVLFIGIRDLGTAAEPARRHTWQLDAKNENAAHHVKRTLLWHLGEVASPASDFAAVEAIIGELVSNVARHTPGPAEVTIECDDHAIRLVVSDRGKPFHSTGEHIPDVLAENGRGLFLIRTLAQQVRVEHTGRGNRISVQLPVALGAPIPVV